MSIHTTITPAEMAGRLAVRELIDACAHYADLRQPEAQADLFCTDAPTLIYMGEPGEPEQVLTTREQHVDGFSALSQYTATTHFNGQFTITLSGESATGNGYFLAHHLLHAEDGPEAHRDVDPPRGHLQQAERCVAVHRTQAHHRLDRCPPLPALTLGASRTCRDHRDAAINKRPRQ